jgi:CubicO group peptidase (beta-lactamase class C family)
MAVQHAVDSIVSAALAGGRAAGMAVAVVRGSDTLVFKGYGKADLEWDVPTPPDALYEIGSITKQFTAAAVLKLVEQGRVDLDADLRAYLPEFDTQGYRVPVRRLLDHTSGIRSYTEMASFRRLSKEKLPRDTLLRLVEREPFDFSPGDQMVYNNTGYFLLGLLIEKVSGQSYAEFVATHLFQPAGMSRSRYCSENAVIERRANGYDATPGGLVRAAYLDHTWPYAAGSLCSTIGDLVAWNRALHGGRILGPAMYRLLVTPEALNDGTVLRYAKGLAIRDVAGHRAFTHGGGINGFVSDAAWFPESELVIVVLVNTAGPVQPGMVLSQIARAVLGQRPLVEVEFSGNLADYAGTYRGVGRGQPLVRTFVPEGNRLLVRGPGGQVDTLRYVGRDRWVSDGAEYTFRRSGGVVTGVRADLGGVNSLLTRGEGR